MKRNFCQKNYTMAKSLLLFLFLTLFTLNSIRANDVDGVKQSSIKVTGTVFEQATNEPLIGVTVKVKGLNTGTITNVDGKFSIEVPSANTSLVFSYISFQSQEIALAGKTELAVYLSEDAKALDEVVVVGYGSMKRTDVATAIATVKPSDFNLGGGQDVRSLLEGQVAGLSVTRVGGGSPNRAAAVQLRGVGSISGSISPLYIIDGIPGGNLDLIRPEDISSIEILKDGSAAAIYGSRASGGVIIVTTKQGTSGKTSVEYSTYMTHYSLAKKSNFLNASEYRGVLAELLETGQSTTGVTDLGGDSDWYNELMNKDNFSHSHNLSVSGGAGTTTYRTSLFYSDSESLAMKDARKDYGGRVSLTTKAYNDMLTIQTNVSTSYSNLDRLNSDNRVWETALKYNPTVPIHNEDGTFWEHNSYPENVIARNAQQDMKRDQQVSSLDAKLTLEPIKDLRIAISGGLVGNEYTGNSYYTKDNKVSVNSYQGGGYASKESKKGFNVFAEPTVSYLHTFADVHKFDVVGGYSYRKQRDEEFSAWNTGFLNNTTLSNDLGAGTGINKGKDYMGMASKKEEDTLIAFFGRVNYVFASKYIAQVSLRREGSTKFGENYRWGSFPSASVAWNLTNEEFMKSIALISNMKLRVGYGVTGVQPNGRYESLTTIGTGGFYLKPDGSWGQTYGPNKNPNPDLKWETKKEWNFGLDFGVLNNRIIGSIDVYKKISSDLIINNVLVPIPSNVHASTTQNIGEIQDSGIELTLNTIPVATKDFTWKSGLTYSHMFSNKLTKYKGEASYHQSGGIGGYGSLGDAFRVYEGGTVAQFYGRKFAGFADNGEWLFYKKDGSVVDNSQITEEDRGIIGNGAPKHHLSFNNNFTYKNFDLFVGFKGRFGFDILNRMKMFYGNRKTLHSGDNVYKDILTNGVTAPYQFSDYYLENGNYVKLDNITVGYTFKHSNPQVPSFRVYATARDLFTITSYDGLDPEMDPTGLSPSMEDTNRIPITRTFMFGLNVKF